MPRAHPLLAFAALALAACAEAPAPDAPAPAPAPATRFEPGGGPVKMLRIDEAGHSLEANWAGVYTPYDPMANTHLGAPAGWTGPVSGRSILVIKTVLRRRRRAGRGCGRHGRA